MLLQLPTEILVLILSYISLPDLVLNVSLVSRTLRKIVNTSSYLWRSMHFPEPITLTEVALTNIFAHRTYFTNFNIGYATIFCDSPTLDYIIGTNLLHSQHLTCLDLTNCNISSLFFLSALKKLKTLSVSECAKLQDCDFVKYLLPNFV